MPVLTRSQNKDADYREMEHSFVTTVNRLLLLCSAAKGKENKMRVFLEVFQIVNNNLPELLKKNKRDVWIRFAATMFNKTTEVLEDERQGGWVYVDKTLSKKFKTELLKCREFTASFVKANSVLSPNQHNTCVFKALEEIQKMEKSRPCRAVTRVDYRDMEPEFYV